jgi:lipoprotein-anchoring transpeptidase ErfK/SrfK
MHRIIRGALVMVGVTAMVAAGQPGAGIAAAGQPPRPVIASVSPARGEKVGVAHPVVVTFGAPVADRRTAERTLGIESSPPMTGTFEWLDDKVVQWSPDRFWPAHSAIALSVGGLPMDFATGPTVLGVASISQHTFTVTIDGADAGPPSALPAPHHRSHWGEQGVFPASLGRPEYETPVGTYTVLAKERSVLMDSSSVGIPVTDPDGYLLTVDWAVRITSRGLFVHSAPWAANALGYENVSHGCISLSPEDAEWYFNTVGVGDPVIVQE